MRSWIGETGLIATPKPNILSFNNLAEAHVIRAMRRKHKLPMQSIRKALTTLSTLRRTAHPLLEESFSTDGISLCIAEGNEILNLTKKLQAEIREFVTLYLERIERDATGKANKLFPFIVRDAANEPRSISISPAVSFGRPVLAGTGISTAVIAGRFAARDSVTDLAEEFDVPSQVLEDAIRWEMLKGKAGLAQPVFFLDENHCGNRFLHAAFQARSVSFEKLIDHFQRGTADTEWIPVVAAAVGGVDFRHTHSIKLS